MALPKSGTPDNNVLKLEDIRNKHKKSKRIGKTRPDSRIGEDAPSATANTVTNEVETNEFESAICHLVLDRDPDKSDEDIISTPAKRSLVSNRRFDKVKVDRIKSELAQGTYIINYLRIADKFIEHERFG